MERYFNRWKENLNSNMEDDPDPEPDPKDPDWNEALEEENEIIERNISIEMDFSDEETGDIKDNNMTHQKQKLSKLKVKAKPMKRIKQKNTGSL